MNGRLDVRGDALARREDVGDMAAARVVVDSDAERAGGRFRKNAVNTFIGEKCLALAVAAIADEKLLFVVMTKKTSECIRTIGDVPGDL